MTLLSPAVSLSMLLLSAQPAAPAGAEVPVKNPLLAPWTGPYGGVPPFDQRRGRALRARARGGDGRARSRTSTRSPRTRRRRPSTTPSPRSSARAGRSTASASVYGVFSSTMSTPEFQAVEREMAPKLAAFQDEITQNEKLFARIAAVYEARETASSTPEQKRLAWLHYTNFVRAGAKLDAGSEEARRRDQRAARDALHDASARTSSPTRTTTRSSSRSEADLAGLPASVRAAAAAAAEAKGQKGKWAVINTRSSRRAVPRLLRPPRPAREGVAHVHEPRRQRRRARQQGGHHRDPEAARRAREAPRLRRRTRTGASRTRWRRRPSARWS